MARRRLGPSLVLVASVGAPSLGKIHHLAGLAGVALYGAALVSVMLGCAYADPQWIHSSTFAHHPRRWVLAILVVLAVAFAVVHPRVTSSSDRDEALDLAARHLLHGRFPYRDRVFADGAPVEVHGGNPISPMPGELLLAAPFVVLGTGALQTFFWLAAFFALASAVLASEPLALAALGSMLFAGPAALHEIVTGGDLLANSLWVLVFGALVVGSSTRKMSVGCAIALGVGLSSRAHFLLVVPILFIALWQRRGLRASAARCGLVSVTLVGVTLPFYLHDPAAFSPFHVASKLSVLDAGLPNTVIVVSVVGALGVAAWLAVGSVASDARLLGGACIALAVPVVVAVILAAGGDWLVWYGVSSMPFGVLAAWCKWREDG